MSEVWRKTSELSSAIYGEPIEPSTLPLSYHYLTTIFLRQAQDKSVTLNLTETLLPSSSTTVRVCFPGGGAFFVKNTKKRRCIPWKSLRIPETTLDTTREAYTFDYYQVVPRHYPVLPESGSQCIRWGNLFAFFLLSSCFLLAFFLLSCFAFLRKTRYICHLRNRIV